MTNLTLGGDMTGDLGDVLLVINLVALVVLLGTLYVDRIESLARRLVGRLVRTRAFMHRRAG